MFIRNLFETVYNTFCIFPLIYFPFSDKVVFVFCNMCMLIVSISFFAGLGNLVVGFFKKLSLWSFNVMKLFPFQLISILSMIFASVASLTPSLFIFVAMRLPVFLCFDVIAFCKFGLSTLLF